MSLDNRHRDKNGEISKKHGNTKVGTLRKFYGEGFAKGFKDQDTLAHVLTTLDESSLSRLVKDHKSGRLQEKVFFRQRYGGLVKPK